MEKVNIGPGQIYASAQDIVIRTVLGSCIAVCIYDKKQRCGGMNHFMLPQANSHTPKTNPLNYAFPAIQELLREMKHRFHAKKIDLIAKIFGGAQTQTEGDSIYEVGQKNILEAKKILQSFGIPILVERTGGTTGLEVEFLPASGAVRARAIQKSQDNLRSLVSVPKSEPVKVLIVDDSKTVRSILKKVISSDERLAVVGEAVDPIEAENFRRYNKVDVITLDINMPKMDGVTYLKSYIKANPTPTIMITDYSLNDSGPVLNALEAGAFDYIQKPNFQELDLLKSELCNLILSAHDQNLKSSESSKKTLPMCSGQEPTHPSYERNLEKFMVIIGASTGGTEAIKALLLTLPAQIPPIVIVQHIPPVFSKAFANRLNELCPFGVKEAEDGDIIKPNFVYIAPGGQQMKIQDSGGKEYILLTDDPPLNRFKPSVDYLYQSALKIKSKKVIAVLLTGMGADGAIGLLNLKQKGAQTIAQDEKTCAVFGMPKAAIDLNAATHILPLEKISSQICELIRSYR